MKKETRKLIIDTASRLFYDRGYNLTGINEIISESGIAKATLYSHFKSKEDLFIAYLELKDAQLIIKLKEYLSTKSIGDKRLVGVLKFLIQFFNEDNFNGCWCIRSIAEVPRENDKIRQIIKNNKNGFKDFLNELILENKPKLSSKKQTRLTNELYLLYEAAVTESHIQKSSWPIETAIGLLKDRLKSN